MSETDIMAMHFRRKVKPPDEERKKSNAMAFCSVALGCALAWMIMRDRNRGIEI